MPPPTIDRPGLRRYDFVYRLAEQYADGAAALLPNVVFSQALARWFQEQGGCGYISVGVGGGGGLVW